MDQVGGVGPELLAPGQLLCLSTDYQRCGHGQAGNSWEAEPGRNLLLSLRFQPTWCPATSEFALSQALALAVARTVSEALRRAGAAQWAGRVRLKWPNDVYVADRKIAGLLLQHTLRGAYIRQTVAGVGLNVNQTTFRSDAPNPVSLRQLTGHSLSRPALLRTLLGHLRARLGQLQRAETSAAETDGTAQNNPLHQPYLRLLYRREQLCRYADAQGTFLARICGVEPTGRLLLTDQDGRLRRYAFKQVSYLP